MIRLLMMVVLSLSLPLSASAAETLNPAEIGALVNDKNVGNAGRKTGRPYDILGLEALGRHMRQNLGSASVR